MLGVVLELLIVKKQLLARGEHELRPAVIAFQDSIKKFHGRLPRNREDDRNGHDLGSLPVPFPCLSRTCTIRARAAANGAAILQRLFNTRDRNISRLGYSPSAQCGKYCPDVPPVGDAVWLFLAGGQ